MGSKIWPFVVAGCSVAVGCGGASNEELFQQPGAGTAGKGSMGGSAGAGASASGGSSANGGSGGSSTGGSLTGGKAGSGTGGDTGGTGTGGAGTGGMGTGGMNTGGSTGGMSTGGTPATGGTGGGSAGSGGDGVGGGPAGSGGVGVGGGPAGSGGVGGGVAGRGGLGGTGGEPDCDALAEQYQKTLEAAQACNPEIDRLQCTVQVQSSILCGCPVWANVDNEEEIAALAKLVQQAERCIVICTGVVCVEPTPGVCSSSGSGSDGHCENGNLVAK